MTLPTDRRAEAEVGKKHGPKCWGRTSYSDEMAHCYCADTPSSAGPDAGLETVAWMVRQADWHEDAYGLEYSEPFDKEGQTVTPLVTRQSAAAALEDAAKREGALEDYGRTVALEALWYSGERDLARAQVADRDKRIAELEAVRNALLTAGGASPSDGRTRFSFWSLAKLHEAFDLAVRAIPTPGRSE